MNKYLARLLEKKGYKSVEELDTRPMPDGSPTERQLFESYEYQLAEKEDLDVPAIQRFCEGQLRSIKEQLKNMDNTPKKMERLILVMNIYDTILEAIIAPKKERESLEMHLKSLIEKK